MDKICLIFLTPESIRNHVEANVLIASKFMFENLLKKFQQNKENVKVERKATHVKLRRVKQNMFSFSE